MNNLLDTVQKKPTVGFSMIPVSESMKGASLVDTEGLGAHLMIHVPSADDGIRRILPKAWYPKLPENKRLELLQPAVKSAMIVILDRLTSIRFCLQNRGTASAAPASDSKEYMEVHVSHRMENIPEKAIAEGAARMGITIDQMREWLRDKFRKGL